MCHVPRGEAMRSSQRLSSEVHGQLPRLARVALFVLGALALVGLTMAVAGQGDPLAVHGYIACERGAVAKEYDACGRSGG